MGTSQSLHSMQPNGAPARRGGRVGAACTPAPAMMPTAAE